MFLDFGDLERIEGFLDRGDGSVAVIENSNGIFGIEPTVLLLGFAVAVWHANRAQQIASAAQAAQAQLAGQLAHSERMRGFLLRHLIRAGETSAPQARIDALNALAARLDAELADDAAAQGELRVAIGEALAALGEREAGEAMIARGRGQLRTEPR